MYKLLRKKNFDKKLSKLDKNILKKVFATIKRLQEWPPFEREYNVHFLKWDYKWYFSINVTWDYRIIFDLDKELNLVYLYDVGTHSQLYS